jgi:hypothetical protein
MDAGQAIEHLARAEARRIRPIRRDGGDLEAVEAKHGRPINAIDVRRKAVGGGSGFEAFGLEREPNHDNAPRLPFLVDFLNRRVLPLVDPHASGVCGLWRVELHDAYSYLPDRHRYEDVLTFGRATDAKERRVALIPDPYHMADFGGLLASASRDPVPWERKDPLLFFAGTTTGDRNPAKNARVRACVWALDRPDVAKMHITKLAQLDPRAVLQAFPRFAETIHAPFSVDEHFRYRYQVNLAGNTACWSRLPMIMTTKSVMVHVRSPSDAMWYYPLLREGRHYVAADSESGEDLLRAHAFCQANDRACRAMADEANAAARDLFHSGAAATYLAALLEESAALGAA